MFALWRRIEEGMTTYRDTRLVVAWLGLAGLLGLLVGYVLGAG